MDGFLNQLTATEISDKGRSIWMIEKNLLYVRGEFCICVPSGFQTDLASVPRVPIVYTAWGDRAHREAVLHDYLYRIGCWPTVTREEADLIFREAMISRNQPWYIYQFMYWGVRMGGGSSYHKRRVHDSLLD